METKIKRVLSKLTRSKKSVIISIVALVEILALVMVSTYSWVESVSSIKIYTSGIDTSGGTAGLINNPLKQHAVVDKTSTEVIDLTDYFRPSGDFHFAPCSSADGSNFYFPETEPDHDNPVQNLKYRLGTISDKNVNYLSFTFKVDSACDLAFLNEPTIKFGDTAVDSNLVRISIGLNGEFNIYSKTAVQEDVVKYENGTEGTTTVNSFSDYVSGANKLLTTAAGDFVTINMWIQDPKFLQYSQYANKKLTVTNFKLVPVDKFTVKALSNETVSGTGGSVAVGNGAFGAEAVAYAAVGSDITLRASANPAAGFGFVGWKKGTSASTATISADNPYSYTVENGVNVIYAFFSDEHTIYLRTGYHHYQNPRYAVYIWNIANDTHEWYSLEQESTDLYKCSYRGTANSIIFCYMDPNSTENEWSNKWLQTFDLNFPEEVGVYTYYVTSRQTTSAEGTNIGNNHDNNTTVFTNDKLMGYWEHSYATVSADYYEGYSSTPGTLSAKLKDSTTSNSTVTRWKTTATSVSLDGTAYVAGSDSYDKTVQLKATVNAGYDFVGWFDEDDILVNSNASCEVIAPNNGVSKTYYAKYKLVTLHTTDTDSTYSGNTIVLMDGSSVGDNNYVYVKMYQEGKWGTNFVKMTDTNFGSSYKNLFYYILPAQPNLDASEKISVQMAQSSSGAYLKNMTEQTEKGWQKVVNAYSGNDKMSWDTYDALHISDVYYPTRLVRGETATIKAKATNGCPKYVNDHGLQGSSTTSYKYYTMTYSIKNSSDVEVASGTAPRKTTSGSTLEKTWASPSDLPTGDYTLTVTLSDGIDSVSRTETITVIE